MELLPIIYTSITIFVSLLTIILLFSWVSFKLKQKNRKVEIKDSNIKLKPQKVINNNSQINKPRKDLKKQFNNKVILDKEPTPVVKTKHLRKDKKRIEVVDNLVKSNKRSKSIKNEIKKDINNKLEGEVFSKYSSSDSDDLKPINIKK